VRGSGLFWIAALAACAHPEPFTVNSPGSAQPFERTSPLRLTYNPGDDLDPAWFPGGDSILYTVERLDRRDRDRCLAVLPVSGGTITRLICVYEPAAVDSMNHFDAAAPAPDGQLAYVRTTYDLFPLTAWHHKELVTATLASAMSTRPRVAFPYSAPGIIKHYGATHIRWLTSTSMVYRADLPHYPQPCKYCRRDAATPVQLVVLDLGSDTPVTTAVPGTIYASSVAAQGPDTLFYTVLGDTHVYRHVLSSGVTDTVVDFGTDGIVRDVAVRGQTLLTVVGGQVGLEYLLGLGWVQNDDGGLLYLTDLATGSGQLVDTGGRLLRRPALSPDGRLVVAESRDGDTWDLWLVELP
jgi:hypothetical protein